jgi:hypothetical protein
MSNYNLSLTGTQVNSALNKVHNADTTPTDGSTNMITSDAVHSAVNNIGFNNLDSSAINTDMAAGVSANTIPTSAAVSNAISTNRPNQLWLAAYKSFSGVTGEIALTNWTVYKDMAINIAENTSDGGFFMPTGHYQIALSIVNGSNFRAKLGYTPAGGSYYQIGEMDNGAGSMIQIKNSGTLFVRVVRNSTGYTGQGYGELTLTIIKLTDY